MKELESLEEKVNELEESVRELLLKFGEETDRRFKVEIDHGYISSQLMGERRGENNLGPVRVTLVY